MKNENGMSWKEYLNWEKEHNEVVKKLKDKEIAETRAKNGFNLDKFDEEWKEFVRDRTYWGDELDEEGFAYTVLGGHSLTDEQITDFWNKNKDCESENDLVYRVFEDLFSKWSKDYAGKHVQTKEESEMREKLTVLLSLSIESNRGHFFNCYPYGYQEVMEHAIGLIDNGTIPALVWENLKPFAIVKMWEVEENRQSGYADEITDGWHGQLAAYKQIALLSNHTEEDWERWKKGTISAYKRYEDEIDKKFKALSGQSG